MLTSWLEKQRETQINLTTLCGTYRWFYEFPEPGVSEPVDVVYHDSVHNPKGPGYLTITCPPGKNPTLKNITGVVMHFGKEARFTGIKRAKDRQTNLLATNHWEFVSFRWKENYGDSQDDGCSILALEISDDDGDPFVMFRYASPGRGGDTWYLDIAAKKERRPKQYGLSSAEMKRLGMQAQYPEVRAAALAEKLEEEESESESGSDDEGPIGKPRAPSKRKPDSSATDELEVRPKKRKAA
ncbi:hypothetical protein DFH07DRAFT_855505 [Mycena maculata]|uniref:Uncharacterized protein n=1 Tax=Mycena maculata TaxID=230809 RepID=A0AAD7MMT9_9AGAR|nr:hypothetical protein DFH07DRAFT_855505 [Mycena maculata]